MRFSVKNPLTKTNQLLLFFILLTVVLYYGRIFLIPIFFGALLAMLMAPVCRKLDARKWSRAASVTTCVIILFISLLSIVGIIVAQVVSFKEDLPQIEQKANKLLRSTQSFIEEKFSIPQKKQEALFKEQLSKAGKSAGNFITTALGGVAGTIGGIALTLVYTFLFLYNKEQFQNFFLKLQHDEDPKKVREILTKITDVSQKYLTGRAKSILILAVFYAIGLLVIGVKNALLLAFIAALLTIIPYIGPFIGGLFPVLMALVTEDSTQPALWVIALLFLIQTLDNYFIEPKVIGGEVNLNALTTIVVVVAGGLIWGVAGMILFIPMLSIVKIVFDHVEELEPYGYILGETGKKKKNKILEWMEEKFRKKN